MRSARSCMAREPRIRTSRVALCTRQECTRRLAVATVPWDKRVGSTCNHCRSGIVANSTWKSSYHLSPIAIGVALLGEAIINFKADLYQSTIPMYQFEIPFTTMSRETGNRGVRLPVAGSSVLYSRVIMEFACLVF